LIRSISRCHFFLFGRRLTALLTCSYISLAALSLFAAVPTPALADRGEPGPWVKLYNGHDLAGWHTEGNGAKLSAWQAEGELLTCKGAAIGYLATDKEYGDFELKLDYRAPKGANSGVGIRFPPGKWPSTDGMEIQILDDKDPKYKDVEPTQLCGAIYSFVPPKAHPAKPAGEWNSMRILCQGPNIEVWINKVEVIHENLDLHNEKGKGELPLSKRPRSGLIGLQCHYDPISFRRIEVREIK